MDVQFIYSQTQLNAAVNFIGTHNQSFIDKFDHIRRSILSNMNELATKFPNCYYIGTMGYLISGDVETEEDIDEDHNVVRFTITVDPSVSQDKWTEEDTKSTTIRVLQNVEPIETL